ncbi:hypothetical protein [Nocardia salmonicida]|uniref:hypothetical protein n=1 Tax=Nocardia salmonicida TaxID=53431 RepID=UPI003645801A
MSVRFELHGVEHPDRPRSVWRFGDPGCPLRLADSPKGIGGAPFKHARQGNARQAGETWRGLTREINLIGLSVRIGAVEPGQVALDLWNSWRDSLGTGAELGEFHVISAGGGDRWQWVRRESPVPDPPLDLLDTIGWCTEEVLLGSDESWWMSAPIHPAPFAPADFAGQTIHNHGDEAAWPFWKLTGPGTFSIGVDGESVTLPMIAAGTHWTVETDPQFPHIKNAAGLDVWESAGNVGWYKPAPARTTVPLTISGTATTSASRVEVWLPQRFERAAA